MESTLIEIITLYQKFEKVTNLDFKQNNMVNFMSFINSEVLNDLPDLNDEYKGWDTFNRQVLMEMVTAHLGKLGRYADNYSRKIMPSTPLNSVEEFTYLIPLLKYDSLSKSELINKNGHAVSTGTEIIKRLIKKKYLSQSPDKVDKRSMRVKLSAEGKGALFSSMPTTKGLAQVSVGILTNNELIQLLVTLKKLDTFHDSIHRTSKHLNLEELLQHPELNQDL